MGYSDVIDPSNGMLEGILCVTDPMGGTLYEISPRCGIGSSIIKRYKRYRCRAVAYESFLFLHAKPHLCPVPSMMARSSFGFLAPPSHTQFHSMLNLEDILPSIT